MEAASLEEFIEHLHPMLVHFPIALLLSAVGLDLSALALKRPGLHRIGLWNLSLGTLGAGLAVLTGLQAEAIAKHSFDIWKVMGLHKRLGITTLILSLMVSAYRLRKRDELTKAQRRAVTAAMLILAGTISIGAMLGGRLVYEFGVGGPSTESETSP